MIRIKNTVHLFEIKCTEMGRCKNSENKYGRRRGSFVIRAVWNETFTLFIYTRITVGFFRNIKARNMAPGFALLLFSQNCARGQDKRRVTQKSSGWKTLDGAEFKRYLCRGLSRCELIVNWFFVDEFRFGQIEICLSALSTFVHKRLCILRWSD